MNKATKLAGLALLALLASQIGGCTTSGARPAYHISASNSPYYWGGYGYRRGYYGGYRHRYVGRPAYYGGAYRRGYRRY